MPPLANCSSYKGKSGLSLPPVSIVIIIIIIIIIKLR